MRPSPCITVPREQGEEVRQELLKEGLLQTDLKIKKNKQFIFFPLHKKISWHGYPLKTMQFEKITKISYQSLMEKTMPLELIPSSFDIIGDIGIIKISDKQKKYSKKIGDALLAAHKNLRVVLRDLGVKDGYRIRQVKWIAGEKSTETIHREYGMKIWLDVTKVYYSPRLSSERHRVAQQVKEGDIIIDMFAGVAPFSILIAKFAHPQKIYAIDKNPDATYYAQKNVQENHLEETIEVITGNAKKILPQLNRKAGHIIMNLPHSAHRFLKDALPFAKTIHYYRIVEKKDVQTHLEGLQEKAQKEGYTIKILATRTVGTYSPEKIKIGVDFKVTKAKTKSKQMGKKKP